MSTTSHFQIPPGYERGIRFGAYWTMILSPYMILYTSWDCRALSAGWAGS